MCKIFIRLELLRGQEIEFAASALAKRFSVAIACYSWHNWFGHDEISNVNSNCDVGCHLIKLTSYFAWASLRLSIIELMNSMSR